MLLIKKRVTAPKHVCDKTIKLNGLEFNGKCLFIEDIKVKSKVKNPNAINFKSPNLFELLRFINNSPDFSEDIDYNEEKDLYVNFKKTVWNSQQN